MRTVPQHRSDPGVGAVAINYAGGDQTVEAPARGIYIDVAGNLAVVMANGDAITFVGLLAGVLYPFSVRQITKAGSTAGGVIVT